MPKTPTDKNRSVVTLRSLGGQPPYAQVGFTVPRQLVALLGAEVGETFRVTVSRGRVVYERMRL